MEIFDSVWKDTFISDNALTKIIKVIRQAINDDANEPRYQNLLRQIGLQS